MATHSSVLAWRIPGWAAVYGVAQSRTRLERLSSSSSSSSSSVLLPPFLHSLRLIENYLGRYSISCNNYFKALSATPIMPFISVFVSIDWFLSWRRVMPGSSVRGILQARILEWVDIPFSRGSSQSRDWTWVSFVSCFAGRFFTVWGTREALTNLDSVLKSKDITLPTKVRTVKAIVFLVVTYGCETWTIQKVEHQRIDASELWC